MPVLISGVDLSAAVAVAVAATGLTLVLMITVLSIAAKILNHRQFRDQHGKLSV